MSEPTGPGDARSLARFAAALAACAGATIALAALAPHAGLPVATAGWAARASFAFAFTLVAAEVLVVTSLARALRGARALALAIAFAGGLGAIAWLGPSPAAWSTTLVGLLLLGAGSSLGAFVGNRILHAGHLGVVAVVSSIADVTSVLHESGPTAQIIESEPALALLAIAAPLPGTADLPPILGVGDVVLAALYLAAGAKHGLPAARTLAALSGAFAGTLLALLLLERALPALPFLGASIVLAHPETRLPPPDERRQAAVGIVLVAAVAVWLWLR